MNKMLVITIILIINIQALAMADGLKFQKLGEMDVIRLDHDEAEKIRKGQLKLHLAPNQIGIVDYVGKSTLYTKDGEKIYFFLEDENGQCFCFDGKKIHECSWPSEEEGHFEGLRNIDRKEKDEKYGKLIDVDKLSLALHKNCMASLDMKSLIKEHDAQFLKEKQTGGYRPYHHYDDKSWSDLTYQEKQACVTQWMKEFCREGVEFGAIEWIRANGHAYGLLNFGEYEEFIGAIPFPAEFNRYVRPDGFFPETILEANDGAEKISILSVNKIKVMFSDDFRNPHAFFTEGGVVYIVFNGAIWMKSAQDRNFKSQPIPVRSGEQCFIPPGFFKFNNKLYIVGLSKADEKKLLLLRCALEKTGK